MALLGGGHYGLQELADFHSGKTAVRNGPLLDGEALILQEAMNNFASNQPDVESHVKDLSRKFQANKDHTVGLDNALRSVGLGLNIFVPKKRIQRLLEHEERYHLCHSFMEAYYVIQGLVECSCGLHIMFNFTTNKTDFEIHAQDYHTPLIKHIIYEMLT